jgi:GDPmannose 4,6-dehydratase
LKRRALIVGHTGQDGRILWDQLLARGFAIVGISRRSVRSHELPWNETVDIANPMAVRRVVSEVRPDQIYYLAAHHHSSQQVPEGDTAIWAASLSVHTHGFLHFLEAIKTCHPAARIFYAASSRVFGDVAHSPQSENTPLSPTCVYGITKTLGMTLADYHRRNHSVFACCGILFNHESALRQREFVSQRIVHGLVDIAAGRITTLELGSLEARVDWGYAPDYTRAMQLILEADAPDDFVVASGETHSVGEMVEIAAQYLGVSWRGRVVENAKILRRNPQELRGDPSRLRRVTGWTARTSFHEMVEILARAAHDGTPRSH